jgi:hypothetical protein
MMRDVQRRRFWRRSIAAVTARSASSSSRLGSTGPRNASCTATAISTLGRYTVTPSRRVEGRFRGRGASADAIRVDRVADRAATVRRGGRPTASARARIRFLYARSRCFSSLYRRRWPGPIVSVQPVPSLPPHWHTRGVIAGTVPASPDNSPGNEKSPGAMMAAEARENPVRFGLLVLLPVLLLLVVGVPCAHARTRETLTLPRADRRAHHVIADVRSLFDVVPPPYHVDPCERQSVRRARCRFVLYLSDGRTVHSRLDLRLVPARGDQPTYVGWKLGADPLTVGVTDPSVGTVVV